MDRNTLIKQVIPLMWEVPAKLPKTKWWSSYGAKHTVERALEFYITNDEFIQAAVELGIPHEVGDPNYGFKLKSRFPPDWFQPGGRRQTTKLRGERQSTWDAYIHACSEIDRIVSSLIQHDTSDDSRFTKLAKVVGHHS